MNFAVKTSLGILLIISLVYGDINFDEQCQAVKCNLLTEICRINPKCDDIKQDKLLNCVYCALKTNVDLSQQPLAPRLLAKSGDTQPLVDNQNKTSNELSYDEYYEYDEDETSDKNEFGEEEDDYLDDYAESVNTLINGSEPIRKFGTCPKVVEAIGKCDTEKIIQPDCRVDTDCPGELKCCAAACGRRVCNSSIKPSVSVCSKSFQCSLNCRLGYRIDSNGCLKCECQSCPSMDQCNKNCLSGYLKDLFGCDICECSEQCPPFSCNILCPPGVSFVQGTNGCPLCHCATIRSRPIERTSSCEKDVHCPPGFRCLNDARNIPMCQAGISPQALY